MSTRWLRLFVAATLVVLATLVAGCEYEGSGQTKVEQNMAVMNNDLQGGSYAAEVEFPAEGVRLRMVYSTDYDVSSWRITDSKTLKYVVEALQVPDGQRVMIEHVHVDVNIQSSKQSIDGLPQDYMDDYIHAGTQPGFLVTTEFPYEEVFSIEGFSQTLINGWGFVSGGMGFSEISQDRLTEDNLRYHGALGNRFTFVYDVLIGNDEQGYHKRIVVQEFLVPLG